MDSTSPKISIGIPVYNGEAFLSAALDSILAQTLRDFEVIISDNASTDGTAAICQDYASRDPRIRYYRSERNYGAAWNFNRVFELATGPYFKWAAADDVCAPTYLECCLEVLESDQAAVLCHSRTQFTKPNGEKWWLGQSSQNLDSFGPYERYQHIVCSGFWCLEIFGLIRAAALEKTKLMRSYYSSDRALLAELSLLGHFIEVPEVLFFRRCHSQQSSRLSPKERDAWISPRTAQQPKLLRPRGLFAYSSMIFRMPLPWQDRTRCLLALGRYVLRIKSWRAFVKQKMPTAV